MNSDMSTSLYKDVLSKIINFLKWQVEQQLNNSLFQKHLGLTLDIKLNFSDHIKSITKKLVQLWVFYVNFNKFCQGQPFLPYIKPS